MRTIVHLSDLHFGRVDKRIVAPLVHHVRALNPDLVAISGDFTQRARRGQFIEAKHFVASLQLPTLSVPGNHDVPLYDIGARFLNPFGPYRRHISEQLEPTFFDDEIALVGLNSARAVVLGGRGRLSELQVRRAADQLRRVPAKVVKVVVAHHPFDIPEGFQKQHLVGRAAMAVEQLIGAGADLFLAGHLHISHVGHSAERYKIEGRSALVVQAGTMSTRGRGESNTFNVLRVMRQEVTVERYTWDPSIGIFARSWDGRFVHGPRGWMVG